MDARPEPDGLRIKLTVTEDEHPMLYRMLVTIVEPRRRTRRLKELAATGLLVERYGGLSFASPVPAPTAADDGPDLLSDAVSIAVWEEKAG